MKTLYWDAAKVAKLAEATRDFKGGWSHSFGDDESRPAEPALLFVKDEGIYLMSNMIYTDGATPSSAGEVLYAKGYGPDADWDEVRDAVGGDDFGEAISVGSILSMVNKMTSAGRMPQTTRFFITVTPKQMKFGFKE